MNNREKIYNQLKKKYTLEELADAIMVGVEEESEERAAFAKFRMERRANMSTKEQLLSNLLHLKYSIKAYLTTSEFIQEKSFGNFLKKYLKMVGRTQKKLAEEIYLHPSRMNRIIKGKEKIGKAIAYRLESHSGEIIPAIFWWKLAQKEIEHEIRTEKIERAIEKNKVTEVAYRA